MDYTINAEYDRYSVSLDEYYWNLDDNDMCSNEQCLVSIPFCDIDECVHMKEGVCSCSFECCAATPF